MCEIPGNPGFFNEDEDLYWVCVANCLADYRGHGNLFNEIRINLGNMAINFMKSDLTLGA